MSVPRKVGRGEEEQVTRPASPSQSRLDYNGPTPNCKASLDHDSRGRVLSAARSRQPHGSLALLQLVAGRGIALGPADRPVEPAHQALLEFRVAPRFLAVAHRGIEDFSLAIVVAPRDDVIAV